MNHVRGDDLRPSFRLDRRRALLAGAAALIAPVTAWGLPRPLLRISTENAATHVQTQMVQLFVNRLTDRVGSRMEIRHHFNATLFRDQDVITAMDRELVEMAVPGNWQLDRFVADVSILMMPAFYGVDAATNDTVVDGEVGRRIHRSIESTLDAVVVGRWFGLGQAHLFSTDRALRSIASVRGLRVRIPGGRANTDRLEAMGAQPSVIPWPDFPKALERRVVDGVLTTFETVVSGHLWEYGIRHCLEDAEYSPQYIPLVAKGFWNRLAPELQVAVTQTWEEIVPIARKAAAISQAEARARLTSEGIDIVAPDPDERRALRERLLQRQPGLAAWLGVTPSLLDLANGEIARISDQPFGRTG
jgi:TRAP-type C4-dicarboxylate transport system substrate-binding protein